MVGLVTFLLARPALNQAATSIQVQGSGFLRLMENGEVVYARAGTLHTADGKLAIGNAHFLPTIYPPANATNLRIDSDGSVLADCNGSTVSVGRIELAIFPQGEAMEVKDQFFTCPDRPSLTYPGQDGSGTIQEESSGQGSTNGNPTDSPAHPATHASTHSSAHHATSHSTGKVMTSAVDAPRKIKESKTNKPASDDNNGGQLEIVIHPDSQVPDHSFTFGDIADITGPTQLANKIRNLWAGNAPVIGFSRIIDRPTLNLRLLAGHIDPNSVTLVVPDQAKIELQSQTISTQDLVASALAMVGQVSGGQTTYAPIETVLPLVVGMGTIALTASDPQPSGNGGYFINVTARIGDVIVGTRPINVAPVPGSIRVKAGDPVTVRFKAGPASVTVSGIAMNQAFLGQSVRVRITGVGAQPTIQIGTLSTANIVEVKI